MLIKTNSLDKDDRLRKEANVFSKYGYKIAINALLDENQKREFFAYNGVKVFEIKLISRKFFSNAKALIVKSIELLIKSLINIIKIRPSCVWVHDYDFILLMPLLIIFRKIGFIKKIVWDQHELPSLFTKNNGFLKFIIKYLMNNVDIIIVTNEYRRKYIVDKYNIKTKVEIIENYPDINFVNYEYKDLPEEVIQWLNNSQYFFVQNGFNEDRAFVELVKSFIKYVEDNNSEEKLIVVGGGPIELKNKVEKEIGIERFRKNILLLKSVPQFSLIPFIDNAIASIIFYKNKKDLNQLYCSPNRLFQALCRKTPVIVGNNPPMRRLVEKNEIGVVADTLGENVEKIYNAFVEFNKNSSKYKENLEKCKLKSWESQEEVLLDVIRK